MTIEPIAPTHKPSTWKPTKRIDRQKAFINHKKVWGTAKLNYRQKESLDSLYTRPAVEKYPSFSLASALRSPSLAINEQAISEAAWQSHADSDCQCVWPNLSNAPVLYIAARKPAQAF
jgi:hypothetical protein